MNRLNQTRMPLVSAVLFAILSLFYFARWDHCFYFKDILASGITFAAPFPYIFLVGFYILAYSYFSKKEPNKAAYPILAIAILISLFYLLADLKIGMLKTDPFGGNRGVYGVYAQLYYFAIFALFSVACALMLRKMTRGEGYTFNIALFIYFFFIETMLFANALFISSSVFLILFLIVLSFETPATFLNKTKRFFGRVIADEKLFLTVVFILALLVRYLWGMRILALTGENFIRASDDGLTYDPFAALIAQGLAIPKESAFYWSGFGYWYFLAGIYRIFGTHNFKAIIIIQSLIGSSVPVLTYLMGKKVFGSRPVAVIASLMTCFNFTLVFLSVVIGMEAIYIPLLIIAMTASAYILIGKKLSPAGIFIIGLLFGLANNARSEVLLFPVIIAFLLYLFLKGKTEPKKIALLIFALFAAFIIGMSIQHITNYILYGDYRLASGGLAVTFAGGYGADENMILDNLGFNPFRSVSGSFIVFLKDPFAVTTLVIKGFAKRIIIYYFKPNFGVFDPVYLVNPASGYFFRFPVWVQFYEYIFILGGIFVAFRKKENLIIKAVMLSFAIYLSGMYGFIWVTNTRHRGVLIPIFILFFAYGISIFYQRVKRSY